ncbi:MAG: hypothetical protein ACXABY_10590 [Candidatus Thorarchaeota archaeon]|jgi:hypothetical protein
MSIKRFLYDEEDWSNLRIEPGAAAVYGQEDPQEYPCVAIGMWEDLQGDFVYAFVYEDDFTYDV